MQTTIELPKITMWKCMWDTMDREGWNLSHVEYNDADGMRHMVRANCDADELLCSAPSLSLAMQVIYHQFLQQQAND